VLADGKAQTVLYDTTDENDLVWGVGLGCQGVVRVLIERLPALPAWVPALQRNFAARIVTGLSIVWESPDATLFGTHEAESVAGKLSVQVGVFNDTVAPPVRLLVFGAGYDAQPLVLLAKELGWHVNVFDPRPALATSARFPMADTVTIAPPEAAASIPLDAWTLAVVMTHRYAFDMPLLQALLPRPLPYLGLLGPKKRTEKILADLAAAGLAITDEMRARLHGPVGLDLGGDTPEAVALAVLAEIQSILAGRDARPLRDRNGPIHG